MSTDIFYEPVTEGIAYGLFASDEPLQIRYVGQTYLPPFMRLRAHLMPQNKNAKVREWAKAVQARGGRVGMRILGRYPIAELSSAERKWIVFWRQYCDLYNYHPH